MSKVSNDKDLMIATLGKSVGIKGEMKLHLKSDFLEQFVKDASFTTQKGKTLTIESVDFERMLIKFVGIDSMENAKKLTNSNLFTTYEDTRKNCHLDNGEFFWFDIIGCGVYEDGIYLGEVQDIDRISINDYLNIKTADVFVEKKLPKLFLIPYIDQYVKSTDIKSKRIEVIGGIDLLEAS
jgi:16S rRNA processing protein RimM